jgi:hypothetical protein
MVWDNWDKYFIDSIYMCCVELVLGFITLYRVQCYDIYIYIYRHFKYFKI